jgi:GNAT superfamily N-acetyltransferase
MAMAIHAATTTAAETETVRLADGGLIRIRPVRSSDKPRFARAFGRMSSLSRYRRFLAHKRALSEADLRFFTEVDGDDHYALVALKKGAAGGEGELAGAARYLRLDGRPDAAEIAVVVGDDHQRRGIGRVLLERLSQAAFDRGIRKFRVFLLAENLPVRKLLEELFGGQELKQDGEIFSGEIPLYATDAVEGDFSRAPALELLRLTAAGAVLPIDLSLILSRDQLQAFKRKQAQAFHGPGTTGN